MPLINVPVTMTQQSHSMPIHQPQPINLQHASITSADLLEFTMHESIEEHLNALNKSTSYQQHIMFHGSSIHAKANHVMHQEQSKTIAPALLGHDHTYAKNIETLCREETAQKLLHLYQRTRNIIIDEESNRLLLNPQYHDVDEDPGIAIIQTLLYLESQLIPAKKHASSNDLKNKEIIADEYVSSDMMPTLHAFRHNHWALNISTLETAAFILERCKKRQLPSPQITPEIIQTTQYALSHPTAKIDPFIQQIVQKQVPQQALISMFGSSSHNASHAKTTEKKRSQTFTDASIPQEDRHQSKVMSTPFT
jgi:hypothetical protein